MSQPARARTAVGLVVVDHGSTVTEANRWHEDFVRAWDGADYRAVEPAHMELAEPSVQTAFDACVVAGADLVIVAPYFLWPGRHGSGDIPALAAAAAERHPNVEYLVTEPLGAHPLLRAVVNDRVRERLERAGVR